MDDRNRVRIIQTAQELFNARGYKNVTINDLATRLGMSKKTIYQYFPGKEEIAASVIYEVLSRIDNTIESSELQNAEPLNALQCALTLIKDQISSVGSLFFEDIQKYLPNLWREIEEKRAEKIKFVERLLTKAQQDGLVREIEPRLAMIIFSESVQTLVKPDSLSRHGYPMVDVMDALIKIFCSGVMATSVTPKKR